MIQEEMEKKKVEVCFAPIQFPLFEAEESIVVVIDILRATSVITTMFINGVEQVIPVKTIDEAKEMKEKGHLVVAERDGKKLDFADFGNSPFYFTREVVEGKALVYSTTNGTNAITIGKDSKQVIIGSFHNLRSIVDYLSLSNENVLLLCAGWKDKFNIEDSVYAGAVVDELLENEKFNTICDSAITARDMWKLAKDDLLGYIDKAAQRTRLRKMGLDDVITWCHTLDQTLIIPEYKDGALKPI